MRHVASGRIALALVHSLQSSFRLSGLIGFAAPDHVVAFRTETLASLLAL